MAKKIVRIEESNEEGRPTREFLREMYPFGESPTDGGSGEGLSQEQLEKLNQAIQKTQSEDILLANGQTLSKEELKGAKGDRGERGEKGEGISQEDRLVLNEVKDLKTEFDNQKEKLNNISFEDLKNIPPNLAESEIKDVVRAIDIQIFELGNVNTSNASELANDSTGLEGFKFWRTKFSELIEFSDKFQYEINFNTSQNIFLKILWYDEDKQYISSSLYKGITYCVTKPPLTARYARLVVCFDDFPTGDIGMLNLTIKKLALPIIFNSIGESIGSKIDKNLNNRRLYTSQKILGNASYYCNRVNVDFNIDNVFDGELSYVYKDSTSGGNITFSSAKNKKINIFNGFSPSEAVNNLNGKIGSYAKIVGSNNRVNIYIFNY